MGKFWEKCKKTCGKCEEDSAAKEEEKADDSCVDTYGACEAYKHICKCGTFGDGTKFWSVCMKTCKCCDGSCAKNYGGGKKEETEEEKKEEEEAEKEKEAEDDSSCAD